MRGEQARRSHARATRGTMSCPVLMPQQSDDRDDLIIPPEPFIDHTMVRPIHRFIHLNGGWSGGDQTDAAAQCIPTTPFISRNVCVDRL